MLRLPPFDYHRPSSLSEVSAILADQGPAARVVAGGTDLWPNMKRRHQSAATVVSLMSIPRLREIGETEGSNDLRVGATSTLTQVAASPEIRHRYPALARAVNSISSPPLRNMGTLGGNLCLDTRCTYYNQTDGWRRSIDYCMKEKGTVCWVAPSSSRCWAHSASDSAPILCALGARVRLDLDHVATDLEAFWAAESDAAIVAAYPGEFLPGDIYEDWAAPFRDEARTRFIAAARRLAITAADAGRHRQAVELGRRLLAVNRYDPDAHELIIENLEAIGETGEADRAREVWDAAIAELEE